MNQVLQRTRPSAVPPTRSSSKLKGFLRSFLPGRRALMLLLLVGGGAALSTPILQGLLRPDAEPGPGRPGGGSGAGESASSGETAVPAKPGSANARRAGKPGSPAKVAAATGSAPPSPARGASTAAAGQGIQPAISHDQAAAAPSPVGPRRPARQRPSSQAPQGVYAAFGSEDLPAGPGADAPLAEPPVRPAAPLRGQAAVRQLGTVSLSDLDPFQGVPCSDSTAALPPARPPEEAWLPGSDASSLAGAEALDPIPVPPIYSESPELAAGPSSHPVQAHRNSLCLKQPSGRN